MDTTLIYEISDLQRVRTKAGASFTLEISKLAIRRSEFIAVIGESGCGKSTLLDLLGLVLLPTHCATFRFKRSDGKINDLTAGVPASTLAALRRSEIGYVLQHGGLLPYLNVQKNVELPQKMNGIQDPSTVQHLMRRLGIEGQARKFPQHLSGGQRQRVAIARALVHQAPVVLADEPTAAVDEVNAKEIMGLFRSLAHELGTTLIMVTHNLPLVREVADRFYSFELERKENGAVVSRCVEVARPA